MNTAGVIAGKLLEFEAVKLQPTEPFTWASGLRSPIYCDNRILLSYPDVRRQIVEGLQEKALALESIAGVAGVATAGIAHGALLADRLDLPFIYVRSKAKAHGRQNQIEGRLDTAGRYVVVEDLISTGGSSLAAVEAIRETGAAVAGVVAIFTYGFEQAARAFREADCPLSVLTDYEVLVEEARQSGYISDAEVALLREWRENPQAWSANHS